MNGTSDGLLMMLYRLVLEKVRYSMKTMRTPVAMMVAMMIRSDVVVYRLIMVYNTYSGSSIHAQHSLPPWSFDALS